MLSGKNWVGETWKLTCPSPFTNQAFTSVHCPLGCFGTNNGMDFVNKQDKERSRIEGA